MSRVICQYFFRPFFEKMCNEIVNVAVEKKPFIQRTEGKLLTLTHHVNFFSLGVARFINSKIDNCCINFVVCEFQNLENIVEISHEI